MVAKVVPPEATDANPVPVADDTSRNFLYRILQMLMSPLGYDKSLQRQRGTVIVESGTVTTVTTVTTCATVTTLNQLGNFNLNLNRTGDQLLNFNGNTAWALNVRARIT